MLERLRLPLERYQGLDILTDRSYKGSTNVFYRWGAFHSTGRLNEMGEPEELVPNGAGQLIPDVRLPRFVLPEGIVDPFAEAPATSRAYSPPSSISLDQFRIDSVLRFTNAGGRYKGVCQLSGMEVVIKEARPNTGFVGEESAIPRLRREVAILEHIRSQSKDLTPLVVKEFAVDDHEYVAIEYLPGTPLSEWIARENPLYSCLHLSPEHIAKYLERAGNILHAIRDILKRLHDLGIAYGDLSVGNVIIDDDDNARFIDFESCTSVDDSALGLRTPDFCLLHQIGEVSAKERDAYAYNCIAVSLVLRLTSLAEISDHVLQAVTVDLAKASQEVPEWWTAACNYLKTASRRNSSLKVSAFMPPSVGSSVSRERLRDMIASAALDCYLPDHEYLFPTSAAARAGAFLGLGAGCSGLLRALKLNGNEVADTIISRYSDSVHRAMDRRTLPVNYDVGIAGIGESCSTLGLTELSLRAAEIMRRDWVGVNNPRLASGLAGISLAFLRQGDLSLAEEVMARAIQLADRHRWTKNGLLHGRSGVIAGACQFTSLLGSSAALCKTVQRLIHEELAQTVRHPKGDSLSLRGELDGSRLLPYLSDGTAGLLLALEFAHRNEFIDFNLSHEDVVALSADLGTPFMLEGSLMDGAAGLAIILERCRRSFPEITDRIPAPGWKRIQKYFLPLKSGVGVFHPKSLKFDLSHSQGSIGILEALLWVDGMAELNISGLYLPPRVVESGTVRSLR